MKVSVIPFWIKTFLVLFHSCLVARARTKVHNKGNHSVYKHVDQRQGNHKMGKVVYTISGNSNFAPCVFPFIYEGKTYTRCTYKDCVHNLPWCATTRNYDNDGKWGHCQTNYDVTDCMDEYESCGDWAQGGDCAANADFMHSNCPRSCGWCTHGGNGQGRQCSFPFFYRHRVIYDCILHNKRTWCATTENYKRNGRWGYCVPKLDKDIHEVNRKYFNFGECDDAHQDCQTWAREGLCAEGTRKSDILKLCPWSCHKCAPEMLVKQKGCKDYSSSCQRRAKRGDCLDFPVFMFAFCRWTCRQCAKSSIRKVVYDRMPESCRIWAKNGDCLTHEKFMMQNCRRSCRTGGHRRGNICFDEVAKCPDWASKGYCNDRFMIQDMKRYCQYSCGWC
ncbi:fibronectin-like [Montipora foliosa]|uniref:fibronectin-like n=1 Tax=Montipora foliosa TaxID=591990 RepID=UPI0035F1DD84